VLIVNADDWGRDQKTTDCILDCIHCGTVSSVSAMVFMADSGRAAGLAQEHQIDAGLHLNLTLRFSDAKVPEQLLHHQTRIPHFLRGHRLSQVVFHPGLISSFDYLVAAQCDQFASLYGHEPSRIDGHHHMHLCANVLFGGLIPTGTMVRRNFSFGPGEKGLANRRYREAIDWVLGRRHLLTDYFFSIQPLATSGRLEQIIELSRHYAVELETHPNDPAEYAFLTGPGIQKFAESSIMARRFTVNQ